MKGEIGLRHDEQALLIGAAALLILCMVFGGDSAKGNLGTMAAQMLAIPMLVFGVVQAARRRQLHAARWGVGVALLILLVPLLQLLPVVASLWALPTERASLLQDLAIAGVAGLDLRWTLSPAATERDVYFLLPGLALFFCMLGLGRTAWRRMLGLLVVLGLANLALAFAQVAAGQDSFLNPYPKFPPAMGGIFANRNHQADLLAISLMLAVVFLLDNWKHIRESHQSNGKLVALAFAVAILVLALPLVGSRAGVIVAMVMLMASLLTSGLLGWQAFRRNRILQAGAALTLLIFVVGLQAALAWMQVDAAVEGSRHALLNETLRIGSEHAPLGSGLGTFVAVFQQGAGDALPLDAYINNAHNEYAQWWLEAGVVGMAVVVLAVLAMMGALVALLRQRPGSSTRVAGMAALMGIGVIVLHSTVDYPLRTQAMLAVCGMLAGIAIAAASTLGRRQSEREDANPGSHIEPRQSKLAIRR